MSWDFQQPSCIDVEASLLGALIRSQGKLWPQIVGRVEVQHFEDDLHQEIFTLIRDHVEGGKQFSAVLLTKNMPEEVKEYCYQIMADVISMQDLGGVADVVRDFSERRGLLQAAWDLAERASEGESTAADIAASTSMSLSKSSGSNVDFSHAPDVAREVVDQLGKPVEAFPTGLRLLDEKLCGGFMPGRMYGIGGRYKGGKSMLMTSISYNMAMAKIPHLYLTLEMSDAELMQRQMARAMGINVMSYLDPKVREDKNFRFNAEKVVAQFEGSGLMFRKNPRMSLDALKSSIARAALSGKIKGVFVDYLQLVSGAGREGLVIHYENVAQTLAECAKQFRIWIVVASQLNQDGGVRYGEGLLNACDMALFINKREAEYEHQDDAYWLEMKASRFTPMQDIGSEGVPAFCVDKRVGPHFREYQM